MKKYKDIRYASDFTVEAGKSEYTFQLKKPNYWWIWLLALIAFLLLCCVRCNHDITINPVDALSGERVECDSITINYTSCYLFKDGKLFVSEHHFETKAPNSEGQVEFEDLPCSVYSYIFYAFSDAYVEVESCCYELPETPEPFIFHFTWSKNLKMIPKTEDIPLYVVDRETQDPLSDATVIYSFNKSGQTISDSISTDAAGKCIISEVPICGDITITRATCYAYIDTTDVSVSVGEALSDPDKSKIPLTPKKESFVYFVKNKFTKEPIPGASVEVKLKNKNNVIRHKAPMTNVDGRGRGAYDDAFIGATLELRASKVNYKDSIYTPICTVQEFISKPDSLRVIYLEPLPSMQNFVNADSISRQPIVGAMNHIVVNSIDGKEYKYDEPSNRNGVFSFMVKEGDKITINSECEPGYEPKKTLIEKFEKADTIFLKPRIVELTFRTLCAETMQLLPDCMLMIVDEDGTQYLPHRSGNGEFIVEGLNLDAVLSIIAEKEGYEPNSTSVERVKVSYLMKADQSERDIPLEVEMLPCDGGASVSPDDTYHQRTYNLGMQSGHTTVDIDFDSAPDYITIYDGPDTTGKVLLPKKEYTNKNRFPIYFSKGCITVVVEGTTRRDYRVNCPN